MNHPTGKLYIVATPIGHLGDCSPRAIETLQAVDWIAAENTQHSRKLLQHFGVTTPLLSYHQHNEIQRGQLLLTKLQAGQNIALISDAGTPLISDPGYRLIATLHDHHIPITPVPGPCAAITALCASGLPTDRFVFEGFLPTKQIARQKKLRTLQTETRTLILYEAPHRILKTLADMCEICGPDRLAVIARELTKVFENIQRGTVAELLTYFQDHPEQQKGEFVILMAGADEPLKSTLTETDLTTLNILLRHCSKKEAAQIAAEITGKRKNLFYAAAISDSEDT